LRLNHVHVGVSEMPRPVAFYQRLGFEPIVLEDHYSRFVVPEGEATDSLHLLADGDEVVVPTGAVHLECDELLQPPTDMPYLWREACLADPDGNLIFLYSAGKNRLDPPWRVDRTAE